MALGGEHGSVLAYRTSSRLGNNISGRSSYRTSGRSGYQTSDSSSEKTSGPSSNQNSGHPFLRQRGPGSYVNATLSGLVANFDPHTMLGPHEQDLSQKTKGFTFIDSSGGKSISCQVDCYSYFQISANERGQVFDGSCDSGRYYSYGNPASVGCYTASEITDQQRSTIVDACKYYSKCYQSSEAASLASTVISNQRIFSTAWGRNVYLRAFERLGRFESNFFY
jgi:hypothetical protein